MVALIVVEVAAATGGVLGARSDSATVSQSRTGHEASRLRPVLTNSPFAEVTGSQRDAVAVRNVKLEPAPPIDQSPSARVTFDLYNDGPDAVGDIVLALSLIEPPQRSDAKAPRVVIAGPVTIRSETVLLPGYSLAYEITLRNLSADCQCVPVVDVIGARPVSP